MGWQKQVYLSSTQFGKEMVIIPPCSAVACLWQMDGNFIWLQWSSTPKYSLFYRLWRLMLAFMQRWQTTGNTGEKKKKKGRRHDTVHHKESGGKPFSLWHAVTKLFLLEEGGGGIPDTPPPPLPAPINSTSWPHHNNSIYYNNNPHSCQGHPRVLQWSARAGRGSPDNQLRTTKDFYSPLPQHPHLLCLARHLISRQGG